MSNQDTLRGDLEFDPFLTSTLQRFTCELYYRFDLFLAPLSVELITSRHYLSKQKAAVTKSGRTNGDDERDK